MLAFASERVQLEAGEALFQAGDITRGAYVLITGVLISQQNTDLGEKEFEVSQRGTLIGQLSLIIEQKRRATFICIEPAELLLVTRASFLKLIEQFPEVAPRAQEMIRNDIGKFTSKLEEIKLKKNA